VIWYLTWFYFLINLLTGGIGTVLAGLHARNQEFNKVKYQITDLKIVKYGFLQCLFAPLWIGWIWGVLYMWTVI
jgi:hypothetical protein